MEAVDLLPVSALQLEPFQEDKKLLPDHLLRQPRQPIRSLPAEE
jgi:hypothetical protein